MPGVDAAAASTPCTAPKTLRVRANLIARVHRASRKWELAVPPLAILPLAAKASIGLAFLVPPPRGNAHGWSWKRKARFSSSSTKAFRTTSSRAGSTARIKKIARERKTAETDLETCEGLVGSEG